MATEESMVVTERQHELIIEDMQILMPNFVEFVEDVLEQFINENPEVTKIFGWVNDNRTGTEQRSHPRFKNHARAIGTALTECLRDLNGIKQHEEKLSYLGSLHNKKKVQYHFYEKLGQCIVNQVENRVGSNWNAEKKLAWKKAYEIITFYMIVRFWMGNYGV
ncbi:uncharacterized protein LOC134855581 isoform X1 [Symsagittifera roscoffensis]|uniref:uncharacterized protein LOC134855581 isoform X1 n=1 Tax=Symsagittifera roscoffensis TaxID=84072 RepID=UPI00307BC264